MTGIGILGLGFMGMIHYLASQKAPGGKVVALATRNEKKRAGDWTMIQGNFGPRGSQMDLSGVATYAEGDELLADPNVQLVDICLPNDQHAEWAIKALEAGKDVLVEKAIALTLEEADRMLDTAARTGRRLMVAHVLPFFPDYRMALDAITGETHGKLVAGHFRRHISPPDWSAGMADFATTGGGPVVDLHVHDTHFLCRAFGTPTAVQTRGVVRDGAVQYVSTQYLYDADSPVLTATSGAISQPSRPFTHGFELHFEKATLFYEAGFPLSVYGPEAAETPDVPHGDPTDAFAGEIAAAVAVVGGQQTPDAVNLDARVARDALAVCLAEDQAARTGEIVTIPR